MYKIVIKKGNIFSEKSADFIVNPSNTELILGSGVSGAFRRVCGSALQNEMRKLAPIKQGEVAVTDCPGHPEYKKALHVAIMDYTSNNPSPTLEVIKKSLQNIEKIIKNHTPCKIVLPLMGVGVGGLDKEEVIKIYKEFFSKNVDFDCEVVIYGYKDEDYALLKKYFEK
ncbi:macro domain-containing protein [Caminibacter pacificus]